MNWKTQGKTSIYYTDKFSSNFRKIFLDYFSIPNTNIEAYGTNFDILVQGTLVGNLTSNDDIAGNGRP